MSEISDKTKTDIAEAAGVLCARIRKYHKVEPEFLHLPETCKVCTLLEAALTQSYSLGGRDALEKQSALPACKRCGKPCPSAAHIFCGAACSVRWEAGDRGESEKG